MERYTENQRDFACGGCSRMLSDTETLLFSKFIIKLSFVPPLVGKMKNFLNEASWL
jgi:hypothetical protein